MMLQLDAMSSGCYNLNLGRCPIFLFLLAVIMHQFIVTDTGRWDAHGTDVIFNVEDVVPKTTWTYAGWFEVLCRTTVDDVKEKAHIYFGQILCLAKKVSPLIVRCLMIAAADALEGKVIYAKLLPCTSGLYNDGRATFSTLKFVHDVEKVIKQILRDTGRGWGKLASSRLKRPAKDLVPAVRPADEQASISLTSYDESDAVPFFDSDTRPHLLVVPCRPEWPEPLVASWILAVTTRRRSTISRRPRRPTCAHQWQDKTDFPLVTARDRCLKEAVDDSGRGHRQLDHDWRTSSDATDVTFFSAIVLAPLTVYWAIAM